MMGFYRKYQSKAKFSTMLREISMSKNLCDGHVTMIGFSKVNILIIYNFSCDGHVITHLKKVETYE